MANVDLVMLFWSTVKDPDEIRDFSHDWSPRLAAGEKIQTSEWSVENDPAGDLSLSSMNVEQDVRTVVWLSGGVAPRIYALHNRVTTDQGRTLDQTIHLRCEEL